MYKKIVVKIGASVLKSKGRLNKSRFREIASDVYQLLKTGKKVIIVSSGAIACGMIKLGLNVRPRSITKLQALAALGQIDLMKIYQNYFQKYNVEIAQVLLTWDDFSDRRRFLNARETLNELLSLNIVPIINENDAVGVEEIKLGDNDRLSAMVASMIQAELLIMLSDVPGIYNEQGEILSEVKNVEEVKNLCLGTDKNFCVGGMLTKLEAVKIATSLGINAVISDGRIKNPIISVIKDKKGTWFPASSKLKAKKHWLAYLSQPRGILIVDSGAENALVKKGKSLLPKGVREVKGEFSAGDLVKIVNLQGDEIARGITNYNYSETRKILGVDSREIVSILGFKRTDELVNRDNLVITGGR